MRRDLLDASADADCDHNVLESSRPRAAAFRRTSSACSGTMRRRSKLSTAIDWTLEDMCRGTFLVGESG
jgi:hypothetical protein